MVNNNAFSKFFDIQHVSMMFFGIVIVYFLYLIAKKIYLYGRYRIVFHIFPKMDAKSIANTAMVISISISIIILLTALSAGIMGIFFRVYPSWRATIEGILIKIGGLTFGPIVGIFIGATTDILTVTLTAGMFHYGYFISALAYGFFAGLIRQLMLTNKKNNMFVSLISMTVFSVLACVVCGVYLYYMNNGEPYSISIFSLEIALPTLDVIGIMVGTILSVVAICWILYFTNYKKMFRIVTLKAKYYRLYGKYENKYRSNLFNGINVNENAQKLLDLETKYSFGIASLKSKINDIYINIKNSDKGFLFYLVPVILLLTTGETIVDIILMPHFDAQLSGGIPLQSWILIRTILLPIVYVVNILVIFPACKAISGYIDYDNKKNVVEFYKKKKIKD